jgi:Uroporphyrinogen decarboxylase (URO-D)
MSLGGELGIPAGDLFWERRNRFDRAVRLEVPDRIPLEIHFGYFPAKYCGVRYDAAYYDYDAWLSACKRTVLDFGGDICSVQPFFPGSVMELVDPRVICWPGRDGADIQSHQYLDGEYMRETEYAHLVSDPAGFMLTRYMPRMSGAMKGFGSVGRMPAPDSGYHGVITLAEIVTSPEVAASLDVLQKIGREMEAWRPKLQAFYGEIEALGFPPLNDGLALAPYDVIADHLRGMRGTMMDLFKRPDELLEACEAVLGLLLANIGVAREGALNHVLVPLHFGSEGFCSLKQFETFYWPTLKGLISGLIERGFTPMVMTEGDYTSRLEYLLELPKGKVFLHFDQTDMFRAKDVLGGHHCISGNVPASLLALGTPDDVRDVAKRLIDYCGREGGFIMASRTPVDDARPENLRALVDFTMEHGKYV